MITRRQVLIGIGAALIAPSFFTASSGAQTVRVRRDVTSLDANDPFYTQYAEAIRKMHDLPASDPRSWRNQAIIHANYCPHGMEDFLEWHRFYITYFEAICGEIINDPEFALPYWNWSNNNGLLPEPFFGSNPLNVAFLNDPSAYSPPSWSRSGWRDINTVGSRAISRDRGLMNDPRFSQIFTADSLESTKRLSDYRLFQSTIEGEPHNMAHVLVGDPNGHMINGLSSLDPVFWLHHCNVDRIWAEWQAAGNTTPSHTMQYEGQFVNASGQSVDVTAKQSHDFVSMGFTYDSLNTPAPSLLSPSDLPEKSIADSIKSLKSGAEATTLLGGMKNQANSTVDRETNLRVSVPDLADNLFGSRVFKATNKLDKPRNAVEPSRVLAILKGVSYPARGDERIIVNVFVDCPYLSPALPSTDPHFAGAFAFFGQPMKEMTMGGTFVIDLSKPLRILAEQGRLKEKELNVQLMPVTVTADGPKKAEFKVSSIEIVKV